MAATKRAMTSLPAPQTIYLQQTEEPEDNRINFRDSLKFFQEQLVLNGANLPTPIPVRRPGNDTLKKNGHRSYKDQNTENSVKTPKASEEFESDIQSIKSCKISIPTVDTILESVRVLRAIQKSQEERGSSWNLDVTAKSDIDFNYTDAWIQVTEANQNENCNKDLNNKRNNETSSTNLVEKQSVIHLNQNGYSDKESSKAKSDVLLTNTVVKEIVTDVNQNGYSDKDSNNERNDEATTTDSGSKLTTTKGITNDGSDKESNAEASDSADKLSIELKIETEVKVAKQETVTNSYKETQFIVHNSNSVNEICSFWPSNTLQNGNAEKSVSSSTSEEENKNVQSEILNSEIMKNVSDKTNVFQQNGKSLDVKLSDKDTSTEQIQQNNVCYDIIMPDKNAAEISNHFQNPQECKTENNKICYTPDSLSTVCTDVLNHLNEKTSDAKEKSKELLITAQETTTEILNIETYEEIDSHKHTFLLNESLWKESCSTSDSISTKIELNDSDSGIGTQRSASSLSPNIPNQMQKDSWSDSCSSQYASAECSPYHSLNSVFESSLGLNNTTGETKDAENSEISTPIAGSEWEEALEKPQKIPEELPEDDTSVLHCNNENNVISEKNLANSPASLHELESHFENAELDTEISYCNFITSYTIEKPCERIEGKFDEAEPASKSCDNSEKEPKTVNSQEISIHEKTNDTEKEDCKQTINTRKGIPEQTSDTGREDYKQTFDTGKEDYKQTFDTVEDASEQTIDTRKCISEQTNDTGKEDYKQTFDTVEEASEQSIDTGMETPEHTADEEKVALVQSVEKEKETREQTINKKKADYHQISLDLHKDNNGEDDSCDLGRIQKFTASSCDLISIVESLYTIKENPAYQILQAGDASEEKFKETLFVLSKGAFCEHPEENYLIIIEDSILHITKDSHVLLSLNMKYAEISVENNIIKIDNRMGRCVYVRCDLAKILPLKAKIELHCLKHWQADCLQMVHYPLKCHQNVIIIDIGSCSTRAGILMDQPTLPSVFFPTICATDKRTGTCVYGMEALQPEVRQHSNLSFPVRPTNKITKHTIDIDLMEGLFKKIFHDLKIDSTQYTVQVCLPRNLSINAQTALVKLLLEDLNAKAVSLTNQALLTLYAHDVSTAVVVDIGDRTDVLPVVDGFIVENGVTRLPHGGQRLIHHMKHSLAEKRISLSNDIDSFVVQYIIENLAYVAEDYDNEIQIAAQYQDIVTKTVTLQPASSETLHCKSITLEEARFKVPEGLFNPDLWGLDSPGIHHLVQKAIQATGVDARKQIAENIYVSGGVTMLPGFVERLNKEVAKLSKAKIVPKVHASNYRYHCTYIGACKLAKMEVFPQVCISLEEYTKNSALALKKCALYF